MSERTELTVDSGGVAVLLFDRHFGVYQGEMFAQVVDDQVDFLRRHGLTAG